jgi:Ulp1 family protease
MSNYPLNSLISLRLYQIINLQQNGVDCGVWVLAQIEALLRGYRAVGWTVTDMPNYRNRLAELAFVNFPPDP